MLNRIISKNLFMLTVSKLDIDLNVTGNRISRIFGMFLAIRYLFPPCFLGDDQATEYRSISLQVNNMLQRLDHEAVKKLEYGHRWLFYHFTRLQHIRSAKKSCLVYFHEQMLIDFNSVLEIGCRFLPELDG